MCSGFPIVPLVGSIFTICTNLITNGTICKEIGANGKNGNTIGANGKNVNTISANGTNDTNQRYHWESPEYRYIFHLSRLMRKPTMCIDKNKDADQLRGNREADQRLCFRFFLNLKFQASSLFL